MKTALWTIVAVSVLAVGPAPGSAAAQTAAVKPADGTIAERIEQRISSDPTLKNYKVDVMVDRGVVTLTGTVPTQAARRKATLLATTGGVARVDNQLIVDASASKNIRGTVGTAGEKTKSGAEKVVDKTKEGLSKTGEVITDGWITTRVKSKFIGEDLLKDSDISVQTSDHVVTLTGTVRSAAGRARAVEQAKEVEGVHRVVDRIVIGPKK